MCLTYLPDRTNTGRPGLNAPMFRLIRLNVTFPKLGYHDIANEMAKQIHFVPIEPDPRLYNLS